MLHLLYMTLIFKLAGAAVNAPKTTYIAVNVGSDLKMSCNLNTLSNERYKIRWYMGDMPISEGGKIFNSSISLHYSLSIGTVPGQELRIKDARLTHAANYKCAYGASEAFTDVSVFDLEPLCEVRNKTAFDSKKLLNCSFRRSEKLSVAVSWTFRGNAVHGHPPNKSGNSVSATLELDGNNSMAYFEYRCIVFLSGQEQSSYSNLPQNLTCRFGNDRNSNSENGLNGPGKTNVTWIVVSCAIFTCIATAACALALYARKHPEVCKKNFGPDIVQQAGVIAGENLNGVFRRVDVHPEVELVVVPEQDEPNEDPENGRVYAEVLIQQRDLPLPPHMHDSPAWNYAQASPAISHSSRNIASRGATPRNGSPIIGLDGTQYLDINSVATIPVPSGTGKMPRRPPARLPTDKYHPAVYAPIDHTARPPPPPPPNDE